MTDPTINIVSILLCINILLMEWRMQEAKRTYEDVFPVLDEFLIILQLVSESHLVKEEHIKKAIFNEKIFIETKCMLLFTSINKHRIQMRQSCYLLYCVNSISDIMCYTVIMLDNHAISCFVSSTYLI